MLPKPIIIDTNIWVSFFITDKLDELSKIIYENDYLVYSSNTLITELKNVLGRSKFKKYILKPINEYIKLHKSLVEVVKVKSIYKNSPDPNDNFLFDLLIQYHANFIVTGDKKLLNFNSSENFQIISLRKFKDL